MKAKIFFFFILFLGISAISYSQTQSAAPAEKKDAPTVVSTPDQSNTGECQHHGTMGAKTGCKFVDANGDGKCDTCGKTEKECKEACKTTPEPKKEGCGSSCPYHKECGGKTPTTTTPPKDGQK